MMRKPNIQEGRFRPEVPKESQVTQGAHATIVFLCSDCEVAALHPADALDGTHNATRNVIEYGLDINY